jgi:hypothetical protein
MSSSDPDYSLIPEHCRESMRKYLENGKPAGAFLTAVLQNNLVQAFGAADEENTERLKDYAQFCYWEITSEAWGSPEKVAAWIERGGLNGRS